MAKCKYDKETFPLLVEGYARKGYSDEQLYKALGISHQTYYDYQKAYPEFLEAIKRGKKPVDQEVVNALLKRALGFEYEEKTTEVEIDAEGKPKPSKIKTTKKLVPADVGAIAFWLKNRVPEEWQERRSTDITSGGKPLQAKIDLSQVSDEELLILENIVRKANGQGTKD